MRADNGAFLHTTMTGDCLVDVEFTLHPQKQFDQAGAASTRPLGAFAH